MQTPSPSHPVVTPVPLVPSITGHSLPLGELLWVNQFKRADGSLHRRQKWFEGMCCLTNIFPFPLPLSTHHFSGDKLSVLRVRREKWQNTQVCLNSQEKRAWNKSKIRSYLSVLNNPHQKSTHMHPYSIRIVRGKMAAWPGTAFRLSLELIHSSCC